MKGKPNIKHVSKALDQHKLSERLHCSTASTSTVLSKNIPSVGFEDGDPKSVQLGSSQI